MIALATASRFGQSGAVGWDVRGWPLERQRKAAIGVDAAFLGVLLARVWWAGADHRWARIFWSVLLAVSIALVHFAGRGTLSEAQRERVARRRSKLERPRARRRVRARVAVFLWLVLVTARSWSTLVEHPGWGVFAVGCVAAVAYSWALAGSAFRDLIERELRAPGSTSAPPA